MTANGVDVHASHIKDVGHAWDKTARNGSWEHYRKVEAYQKVIAFLGGVYDTQTDNVVHSNL